ncbi:hypothetical protein MSAN_00538900 [Mycena sanguinolenta]|uniref:Uncharacterized protein n=1 Tax=Mycena sanguinolenta TaxID=230812 RepID=A0A8H6Z9I1_9AGAR|nr:hypothetical protein MSAN_00538900 [Mycena sanguinolenta]
MALKRFLCCQSFTGRKTRTTPSPVKFSAGDDKPERPILEENFRPNGGTVETAANVPVSSLSTLSGSIPMVGALGGIMDAPLGAVGQVQQTPANEQSFAQLAARIERLTPMVTENDSEQRKDIVEKLQKELASMTEQLNAARDEVELDQFFNSILQNHNIALDQMIADSTQQPRPEITGETGSTGASGDVGGEGGEGKGPQIDMDPGKSAQISKVSGGTGGTGGAGVQVGGKGGTGKGPAINLRRMRAFTSPEPQVDSSW